LSVLSATSIQVNWTAPAQPNGAIVKYSLWTLNSNSQNVLVSDYQGTVFTATLSGLSPATQYSYAIQAFTALGGSLSDFKTATTQEAAPSALAAPTMPARTSTSLTLQWTAPLQANGALVSYNVYVRNISQVLPFYPAFVVRRLARVSLDFGLPLIHFHSSLMHRIQHKCCGTLVWL
jgi:hypothetical protein